MAHHPVMAHDRFTRFRDFYPFYLGEHSHPVSRRLHFAGTCGVVLLVAAAVVTRDARWLWGAPACGYGFAWIGHYVFEKNRPATFRHPLYSLMGDWMMFIDVLRGRVRL